MVAIVRTEWDGTSGGPGLTQFALLGTATIDAGVAQAAVNATAKFWGAVKAYLPDEVRLTVNPVVDVYNDGDAELIASYSAGTAPAVIVGTGSTGYAGGAGVKINWTTGQIRNGRRVKGATFIVPVLATAYTATGTAAPGVITAVNAAANVLISDLLTANAALAVWSRPLVKDDVITRQGGLTLVSGGALNTKTAILRGRRD